MHVEEHPEGSSVNYRCVLTDGVTTEELPDGTPIPLVAVLDLTLLNLYDGEECVDEDHPPVILDSRQNIALITNGIVQPAVNGLYCSYGVTNGKLVVHFPASCQAVRLPAKRRYELHVATFHFEHTTDESNFEVGIKVKNLGGVA